MLSDLTDFDIFSGILAIIYIVINFIVGFLFFNKVKQTETQKGIMGAMGFFVITLSSPWWPVAIQFIVFSAWDIILTAQTYLFLTYWLVPLGMILWLWVVQELAFKKSKKYRAFFIYSVITCVGFYIFIMANLFILNPDLIGTKEGYMNVTFGRTALLLSIYGLTINLISAVVFYYKVRKGTRENKLKALFMLLGFIFFTFSAVFQTAAVFEGPLSAVLLRVTAVLSSICFYFVFFLPKILRTDTSEEVS